MGVMSYVIVLGAMVGFASPPIVNIDAPRGQGLATLVAVQPTARVRTPGGSGHASLITGLRYDAQGDDAQSKAEDFLRKFAALTGAADLKFRKVTKSRRQTVVQFDQWVGDRVVLDRSATVTLDVDGRVRSFNSDYAAFRKREAERIDSSQATRLALRHLADTMKSRLPVVGVPTVKRGAIVFAGIATDVFEVHTSRAPLAEHLIIRIDAHRGEVLSVRDAVIH